MLSNSWCSKNECALKEGAICRDPLSLAAEVGRDRQEMTQVMVRRNSCCPSIKVEMSSSTLGSLSTFAVEIPTTSENTLYSSILTISMSTLKVAWSLQVS